MDRRRTAGVSPVLAAAFCVLALTSCSSVPRQMAPLRVQLTSLSLLDGGVNFQRFAAVFSVDNPNAFDVPVDSFEFSARLSGQGVLIGDSSVPTTFAAGGTDTLRIEVTTEIVSSFESLLAVVQGPDNAIPYDLNGVIRIQGALERRVPFSYSGRVPLSAAAASR